jgi:hypothetical protein
MVWYISSTVLFLLAQNQFCSRVSRLQSTPQSKPSSKILYVLCSVQASVWCMKKID